MGRTVLLGAALLGLALAFTAPARADFELVDKKGRRVLLKDNGTWRFIESKDGAASAPEEKAEVKLDNMLELQITRRVESPGGCTFELALANKLPFELRNLVPDFSAYRANGLIHSTQLTSFAWIKPSEVRSKSVQFNGIACWDIARLQVHGGDRCEVGELNKFTEAKGKCLAAIKVVPSELLTFEK
ncbi:hypothetical protein WG899_18045 [Paucibacter sp. AS339]|uniref:hypothetical protein n=1 Tax=Paucibacter hankyongi TaxID=3133434 RepID=UPI0030B4D2B5